MKKITDIHAAIRARAEAAGINGFYINTGSLSAGIKQPDIIGFFPLPGTDLARLQGFDVVAPAKMTRGEALKLSDIKRITTDDLDALLAPLRSVGLLRTTYERCTGATEYRGPSGRVIAASIGGHHFARRDAGAFSLAMHAQFLGRIKRVGRTIHQMGDEQ